MKKVGLILVLAAGLHSTSATAMDAAIVKSLMREIKETSAMNTNFTKEAVKGVLEMTQAVTGKLVDEISSLKERVAALEAANAGK